MIKITVFAVICAFVYVILKKCAPEYAHSAEIFAIVALLIFVLPQMLSLLNFAQDFFDATGVEREYFTVLIKVTGIALLAQFAADTCRDSGEAALASQVEFAGKILMLVAATPVIKAVMQTALTFFGQ